MDLILFRINQNNRYISLKKSNNYLLGYWDFVQEIFRLYTLNKQSLKLNKN